MAEELKLNTRQRGALKTNVGKEIDKVAQLGTPESAESVKIVKNSLIKINDYRARILELNKDILLAIEDDTAADTEVQSAADFDDNILENIASITTNIDDFNKTVTQPENFASSTLNESSLSNSQPRPSVKLPKLHIAKFGGDPLKWQEFWDSFSGTVHENSSLSPVDKFKYLKSFITGDVIGVIGGYRMTSDNYTTVIEALRQRYGNKQIAINAHIDALLAIPVATHDIAQLQKTYDDCERHIRSLIALGLAEETFGQIFTPIILSKLPLYVKMEIHRKLGTTEWSLSSLRELLKEEIRAREMCQRSVGVHNGPDKGSSSAQGKRGNQKKKTSGSSASLVANTTSKTYRCSLCGESHYTDQCKKYADLQSRKQRLQGRCQICLSTKHPAQDCPHSKNKCYHCQKTGHHRSLCPPQFGKSKQQKTVSNTANSSSPATNGEAGSTMTVNSSLLSHGEHASLQTALEPIRGTTDDKQMPARLLFDTGSTRTFITTAAAQKIAASDNGKDIISLAGFAAKKRTTATYQNVTFQVVLPDGSTKAVTANVIPSISCAVQKMPVDMKKYPVMKNMKLAEPVVKQTQMIGIDVLIGNDYYYDFIGNERIECDDGLIFLSSCLGFIVTGRVKTQPDTIFNVSALLVGASTDSIPSGVERYWSLEDIGVKTSSTTNDDEEALRIFNETVKYENGRYSVVFPLKSTAAELPDNKALAHGRLKSLLKRLNSDPALFKSYDDVIQDQLSKGIIEYAPETPTGDIVHYIPHHCVVTPQKTTTKVRIVYDASAKASKTSPSLNDCMYRGPVLLDDLCGLLLRFRTHAIGLVSDIEKAFLQVGLQESARDITRFLWVITPQLPPIGDNLLVFRFTRVLFGAKGSPFLLGATVHHHLQNSKSPAAADVNGNTYVDNVMNGKNTVEEAIALYKSSKDLFNEASMNLRESFTNSDEVREAINPTDRGQEDVTKVLGLAWDTKADTLSCSSFTSPADGINTKRLMLKYLAKVFDPCGFFSAVTVSGKLLIQQLWQQKYDWDDRLPTEFISKWEQCSVELQRIPQQKISRVINFTSSQEAVHQLHCFCDASGKAYSAVVYLMTTCPDGIKVNLVFAKARVAPVKEMSIPRLELMAALIGARLIQFVEAQLRLTISNKWLWSDSQCVLHWLVKETISTVFVKNRVNEIRSHTGVTFRYVPTDQNPADLSSRGCSLSSLVDNSLWWNGPSFLTKNIAFWPKDIEKSSSSLSAIQTEDANGDSNAESCLVQATLEPLLNREDFSSLKRLYRVTSWVMRFINNARKQNIRRTKYISAEEMSTAQFHWEKSIQQSSFPGIVSQQPDKAEMSKLKNLSVFTDNDGLLRCGGRFQNADMDDDAKFPKLLPKNNAFTDLVIQDYHEQIFHYGVPHTLSQIRSQYWIIHGRGQVTRVLRKCMVCKLAQGKPYSVPSFPPLPEFRVTKQKPFSRVGIDYMGPLLIKTTSGTQKVWIALFTCAVIRAIYLDVVDQLSAEQFMLCLRRFISKHGKPELIISDNAKQFHATNTTLHRIWRDIERSQDVQEFSANRGIKWHFITELSPWMGGFYERMVGVVKRGLKKSLDRRCVSLTELQTVVSEIAAVVNSRPLTYSEAVPFESALTPSHFIGGPHSSLPHTATTETEYKEQTTTAASLILQWKRIQSMLDSFWASWRDEYLLSLRNSSKCFKQTHTSDSCPCVGSVVQIKDNTPRNQWKLGVISALRESADGKIRTATLRLPNQKTIHRPIKLLYPLEFSEQITEENEEVTQNEVRRKNPKRRAAITAAQKCHQIAATQTSSDDSDN